MLKIHKVNSFKLSLSSKTLMMTLMTILLYAYSHAVCLTVTSPDAVSVPGGYVVPVGKDIVFRCHAPQLRPHNEFHWNIKLGDFVKNITKLSSENFPSALIHKISKNISYLSNPTILNMHNPQLNESGSTIQCLLLGRTVNDKNLLSTVVHIFVEGQLSTIDQFLAQHVHILVYTFPSLDSPKCPGNLTIAETPLGFNLTWSGHSGLLPVTYNISVVSHSSEVVMSTSNSHKTLDLEESGYNWQSNTTNFVSVTACTSAGCSKDCGNTTIRTGGVLVV